MIFKPLYFLALLCLLSLRLLSSETEVHQKVPLAIALPYLQTIETDAITMGSGPVKVYVFVDPYCPHSRNFLSLIAESKKMRMRYTYKIFLYTLPRMQSEVMVSYIYGSPKPLAVLLDVMVHGVDVTPYSSKQHQEKIFKIAAVAKQIDIYKRPYLIMVKKPKKKRAKL